MFTQICRIGDRGTMLTLLAEISDSDLIRRAATLPRHVIDVDDAAYDVTDPEHDLLGPRIRAHVVDLVNQVWSLQSDDGGASPYYGIAWEDGFHLVHAINYNDAWTYCHEAGVEVEVDDPDDDDAEDQAAMQIALEAGWVSQLRTFALDNPARRLTRLRAAAPTAEIINDPSVVRMPADAVYLMNPTIAPATGSTTTVSGWGWTTAGTEMLNRQVQDLRRRLTWEDDPLGVLLEEERPQREEPDDDIF